MHNTASFCLLIFAESVVFLGYTKGFLSLEAPSQEAPLPSCPKTEHQKNYWLLLVALKINTHRSENHYKWHQHMVLLWLFSGYHGLAKDWAKHAIIYTKIQHAQHKMATTNTHFGAWIPVVSVNCSRVKYDKAVSSQIFFFFRLCLCDEWVPKLRPVNFCLNPMFSYFFSPWYYFIVIASETPYLGSYIWTLKSWTPAPWDPWPQPWQTICCCTLLWAQCKNETFIGPFCQSENKL